METITTSAQETKSLGKKLATALKGSGSDTAYVIGLNGNLGSGKTTFVQGFACAAGVTSRLLSPTYIIVRRYDVEYSFFQKLIHMDLYRIEKEPNMHDLGFSEIFSNPCHIVLVEWPNRLGSEISPHVSIDFKVLSDTKRAITW